MNKLTKQDYLKKCKEYATSKGGICLSDEYINAKTKMEWKCANENHSTWLSDADNIVNRNRWCRKCGYNKKEFKDGYDICMKYAKSRGGFVLVSSNTSIKSSTRLTWKCSNHEHKEFTSTYRNIVQKGGWCPFCAGKFSKEEYLQKAKDYAISKGGICLSNKYENQNTKLKFKCCDPAHKILVSDFDRIVPVNRWCKECEAISHSTISKKNEYLEKAKKHAISKGGQCLSDKYINSSVKLKWQCSNKHKPWLATYQNVVGNLKRWCPECAGQFTPSEQLQRAKDYAKSKDGQCLSTEYKPKVALLWKCCEISHKPWHASIHNVMKTKNNTWCPECGNSIYYKENNTRIILEFLLGFTLRKARPIWNMNPETNHTLELDGYNEEKMFAFEFQGRHHFEANVFKNHSLEDVQKKDKLKRENCIKHNVYLLAINDKKHMGSIDDLINYIVEILNQNKIKFNENFNKDLLLKEIERINKINSTDKYLKKAKEYAISRGGECLSQAYINYNTKLEWKCDNKEHPSWFAIPYIYKSKSWCPQCAGKHHK